MKRRISLVGIALVTALLISLCVVSLASAHEVRHVGPYTFVVGFLNEPAYAGQENSIDLTICNGAQCNYTVQNGQRVVANPVQNAEQTLKAEVSQGGVAPLALPLEARYANPGKYASYFIPSKVGTYTFHIFGTLPGMKIDEKFTSGPDTFSDTQQIQVYPSVTTQASGAASNSPAMALGIAGLVAGVLGLVAGGFALTRKPQRTEAAQPVDQSKIDSLRG
jgi:hypothetical protein